MERELVTVKNRRNTVIVRPLHFRTILLLLESFGLELVSDFPKLKELSDYMGGNQDPKLFSEEHALE